MHDEKEAMVEEDCSAVPAGQNTAISRRLRTALVFLANLITGLLPTSRCYP
jgi:hypothetical protein